MSDLTLTHSSHRFLDVAVTNDAGTPLDISQSSFWWTVRTDWLESLATTPLISKTSAAGISIINGPGGLAQVAIVPADWATIANEPGRLVWELMERDSVQRIYRLDAGDLLVVPAMTEVPA